MKWFGISARIPPPAPPKPPMLDPAQNIDEMSRDSYGDGSQSNDPYSEASQSEEASQEPEEPHREEPHREEPHREEVDLTVEAVNQPPKKPEPQVIDTGPIFKRPEMEFENTPCRFFPKCRFGRTCKYRHPNCKIGRL